jgi:hypothetical protein
LWLSVAVKVMVCVSTLNVSKQQRPVPNTPSTLDDHCRLLSGSTPSSGIVGLGFGTIVWLITYIVPLIGSTERICGALFGTTNVPSDSSLAVLTPSLAHAELALRVPGERVRSIVIVVDGICPDNGVTSRRHLCCSRVNVSGSSSASNALQLTMTLSPSK